jgi:hypothetical protein
MNIYITKPENSKLSNLLLYLKKLEKPEKRNPKLLAKIKKINAKINEIEIKNQYK